MYTIQFVLAWSVFFTMVALFCGGSFTRHNPRKGFDDTLIHLRKGMTKGTVHHTHAKGMKRW